MNIAFEMLLSGYVIW